jgi:hypothetical protein
MPFKSWLKRRDIDDDAAPGIGTFPQTDRQRIARHFEVLYSASQCKRVGRYNADIPLEIHYIVLIEVFGIDYLSIDIGKDLELIRYPDIISIRAKPITYYALSHKPLTKRSDHLFV